MREIGVDIGGTFTDVVCRRGDGSLDAMKIATNRADPSGAVLEALEQLQEQWGLAPEEIGRFVHGTTVATNAVLERKGPKTGLLTTAGFRDVLEIGRQIRQRMYAATLEPEVPTYLAPGALRREVVERISSTGEVVQELDENSVREAARDLVEAGVEGIAICFLFSFVNTDHEQRAAEIIRSEHPDIALSCSSDVDPAFREYERTVVTAFDAYIKPVIDRYLENLEHGLEESGVPCPLQVMQSRGGTASSGVVRRRPVRLFLSGPAAGVVGAQGVGRSVGLENLISVDIGGTSCDIALIQSGKPLIRPEGMVGGYNIRVPMVDVNAIGSGGGSIAWIDEASGLRVGPHSAGSEPGPACYGRGGTSATVTDASLVLGYLNPDNFAGGMLRLDPDLAYRTIESTIAESLDMTVHEAALGIHRVANTQMAEGIRLVSIRQGYDPREFAMLPLGGAGGIHATALAEELGIDRVVIGRHPGVLSAVGLLSAKIEHETSTAFNCRLEELSVSELEQCLEGLDRTCGELMACEGVSASESTVQYFADVCYVGQSHYLEIPFTLDGNVAERLYADFRTVHKRVYGHSTDSPAAIVNVRSIHSAGGASESGGGRADGAAGDRAAPETRSIILDGLVGRVQASIHERDRLSAGETIQGPAILEQADTTSVVPPRWSARVHESASIVLSRNGDGE